MPTLRHSRPMPQAIIARLVAEEREAFSGVAGGSAGADGITYAGIETAGNSGNVPDGGVSVSSVERVGVGGKYGWLTSTGEPLEDLRTARAGSSLPTGMEGGVADESAFMPEPRWCNLESTTPEYGFASNKRGKNEGVAWR